MFFVFANFFLYFINFNRISAKQQINPSEINNPEYAKLAQAVLTDGDERFDKITDFAISNSYVIAVAEVSNNERKVISWGDKDDFGRCCRPDSNGVKVVPLMIPKDATHIHLAAGGSNVIVVINAPTWTRSYGWGINYAYGLQLFCYKRLYTQVLLLYDNQR